MAPLTIPPLPKPTFHVQILHIFINFHLVINESFVNQSLSFNCMQLWIVFFFFNFFLESQERSFEQDCHPWQRPRFQEEIKAIGLSRVNNFFYLCIIRPPVSTLFLNIFTLQAVTQSVDNLFHSFLE